VDIELEMPEDLPPLDVDALRLEQVMLNLLENAVAYSNPPRRIVLSAALDDGRRWRCGWPTTASAFRRMICPIFSSAFTGSTRAAAARPAAPGSGFPS
jgi:signal transduction histidine kinase